jgi:hypothetical protein
VKGRTLALITIYTIAATLFASPMTAQAAVLTFAATLSGALEIPPSLGTGFTTVSIDTVLHTLTVDVSFSGLTSGTTASHIHCCAGSEVVNSGVATTVPTFSGFPLGVTSGTYHNVLDMTSSSSYNPTFITGNGGTVASAEAALFAGIIAGDAYLHIHTTSGEISGLLAPIPLPATLPLFATGLAGLGLLGWRRKKAAAG